MATNITKVYLLDVPLENDYKNTLYFASKAAQQSYFQGAVVKAYDNFSYQRKDQIIRIPDIVDNIYHCNYVMYQNSNYSNKWFYAFITDMKYINDGTTEVHIETDCIQTWLFDYVVKSSFVEREHVDDDTIGLHTVPEQLETGDYVDQNPNNPGGTQEVAKLNFLTGDKYIVIGVSENGMNVASPQSVYNNVYSGLQFITFPSVQDFRGYIDTVQRNLSADNIYCAFMAPASLIMGDGFQWLTYQSFQYAFVSPSTDRKEMDIVQITKPTSLDGGYVPRNNKLLTYPYRYFALSNNAGAAAEYKYEYFSGANCDFVLEGAIGVGCSIQAIPYNYKKGNNEFNYTFKNYMEALDAGKLPTVGWTNDSYINWLTQNAINLPLSIASDTIKLVGGAAVAIGTGGAAMALGGGMAAGGLQGILGTVGEIYAHSTIPATAKGGANQGDLAYASKRAFTLYKKTIKREMAQIIDGFFDMFGYKVNMVKVPNKAHRARWWYTKTIDVNIDGAIPNNDMQTIKNAYNNGITFWRNASEIQNYSLSNGIV